MERIRLKFGRNPYHQRFTCASCRRTFERGGFFIRIQCQENTVDFPLCQACLDDDRMYETMVDLGKHNTSYPVGLA